MLEGLIVLTLINIMVVLIFSYIRNINDSYTEKIHKERSTLLLAEIFEKIRSARDTAVNQNRQTGWKNFTKEIVDNGDVDHHYVLERESAGSSDWIEGQWHIVPEEKGVNSMFFSSEIAPYATYYESLKAYYPKNEDDESDMNKVVFEGTVRWREDEHNLYSVTQSMVLTNNSIYENLY